MHLFINILSPLLDFQAFECKNQAFESLESFAHCRQLINGSNHRKYVISIRGYYIIFKDCIEKPGKLQIHRGHIGKKKCLPRDK